MSFSFGSILSLVGGGGPATLNVATGVLGFWQQRAQARLLRQKQATARQDAEAKLRRDIAERRARYAASGVKLSGTPNTYLQARERDEEEQIFYNFPDEKSTGSAFSGARSILGQTIAGTAYSSATNFGKRGRYLL